MFKVLFANVEVAINLNGKVIKTFEIKRRIRQGCPLVPYLFFIIGEMLNVMVKSHSPREGEIQGIKISEGLANHLVICR
jgi:hypothetical protein